MPILAGDLELLRSFPQRSRLYLVVQQPERWEGQLYGEAFLWYCQINGDPTGDPVVSLTVDNGGPNATLLDRMTVLIGSTPGAWDRGIFCLRGDQNVGPGTVTLDIAPTSEVTGVVQDNDYVTVLDEFRLWARYPRVTEAAGTLSFFKDWDITFASLGATAATRREGSLPPCPIMGPHAVRFVPTDSSVWVDWDGTDSYTTYPGATINAWTWAGERDSGAWASAAQNPAPAEYTSTDISGLAGYRVTLEVGSDVQDSPAQFRRGVRYVFTLRRPGQRQDGDPVNAEPIVNFEVGSISGSFDSGRWRTSIRVYGSDASELVFLPGALVILFADDYYAGDVGYIGPSENGSVGPIRDRENIVMVGRIVDNTIREDSETGDVSFDIVSISEQAAKRENYPVPIENNDSADEWYEMPDLSVFRAAWHYAVWHTTLPLIADFHQLDTDVTIPEVYANDFLASDLYSAIDRFLWDRQFARLLYDRFERGACQIDQQMKASRTAPTLFHILTSDWLNEVQLREVEERSTSYVELGGVLYNAGLMTPYLAGAPGAVSGYRGTPTNMTHLAINSQAELNTFAGRFYAYRNNQYPDTVIPMAGNWRVGDIWPQEYVVFDTLTTQRKTFTDWWTLLREITYEYDARAGAIFATFKVAQETSGLAADGITIAIPEDLPAITPQPIATFPPIIPPGTIEEGRRIIATNVGVFATDNINDTTPIWYDVNAGLPNDATRRCWKIFRDPWHWWTSGGSERTMWGIFSDPADIITQEQPRYIYKHENFPYGTWTLSLDAADITINPNPTFQNWVEDLVPTIEVEDKLYAIVHHHTAGLDGGYAYLVTSTDGGATWVENLAVTINTLVVNGSAIWPHQIPYQMDTAKHSGSNTIYVSQYGANGSGFSWELKRSLNAGGAWALHSSIAWTGAAYDSVIQVPYDSASWGDSVAYHRIVHPVAGAGAGAAWLRRSADSGATFTNIGQNQVAAGYVYRAGAAYNRSIYATLQGNTTATNIDYTDDGGSTWETWVALAHPVGYAALFDFNPGGSLLNVLLSDTTAADFRVWLVDNLSAQDKTGNLTGVATGIDQIVTFERDSMGSA